ncbi:Pepsin-retropepsin like protein [Abeliophyllum distichum]|uniref:Pepsin-retropepsin like protein n=1 Tax=Abeliophyllum distichum TaxID=126358 RepID=A0ABD1PDW8_9LAMI
MSFPEVTDKALLAEQAEVKIVRAREARNLNRNQNQKVFRVNKNWNENKKKWAGKCHGGKQNEPHLKRGRPDNQTEAKASPSCTKCGKTHNGECLVGQGMCFYCKKPGHIIRDCPDRLQKDKGKARVYAMVRPENEEDSHVVAGTIYIKTQPVYALFELRCYAFLHCNSYGENTRSKS